MTRFAMQELSIVLSQSKLFIKHVQGSLVTLDESSSSESSLEESDNEEEACEDATEECDRMWNIGDGSIAHDKKYPALNSFKVPEDNIQTVAHIFQESGKILEAASPPPGNSKAVQRIQYTDPKTSRPKCYQCIPKGVPRHVFDRLAAT